MPRFTYVAKSHPGKTIRASIEAESEEDAVAKLAEMGRFPLQINPDDITPQNDRAFYLRKVSSKEIALFSRQLSSLVESGINIMSALDIVYNQAGKKYLKAILKDVINRVKDGSSLSKSLEAYPDIFSNLYTSMIRTGETSGDLSYTLNSLVDFLEKEQAFRSSVRSSLVYPAFVVTLSVLTVLALLGFVIPRLVTMFEDLGQILPLPTRILIGTSRFLRGNWWVLLAAVSVSIFFIRRTISNPKGRLSWDSLKLKTPIVGTIILKSEISHFTRALSLLLSSGVAITSSLEVSTAIVNNKALQAKTEKIKEQIARGSALSNSIKDLKIFPDFVTNIIVVGEETGSLDKALLRIANDYEREVDSTLKTLTVLLEPVIILIMGAIVGFIVLSMLLPIFQINLVVR